MHLFVASATLDVKTLAAFHWFSLSAWPEPFSEPTFDNLLMIACKVIVKVFSCNLTRMQYILKKRGHEYLVIRALTQRILSLLSSGPLPRILVLVTNMRNARHDVDDRHLTTCKSRPVGINLLSISLDATAPHWKN